MEARRVDVGFDYGSSGSRGHERSGRNRTRGNDDSQQHQQQQSQQQQTIAASSVPSVRGARLTDSDFPGINGQPASQQQQQQQQQQSNSTSNRRQQKSAFRKPAGFGALSDNWPALGQSSSNDNVSSSTQQQNSSPSSSSSTTAADGNKPAPAPEIVSRHAAFMDRVFDMLKSPDKLGRFRALTTAYRNSNIDVDTYVNEIVDLCDGNNENSGKIFKGVEDLMDNQEKKWEIVRAWRDKQTSVCLFFQYF